MKIGLAYPVDSMKGGAVGRSGLVYSVWRGMQVARRHVIPANPSSTSQDAIRAYVSASAKAFQGITAQQKVDWQTFAALYPKRESGVDVIPPAISAFCMVNNWRQIDGEATAAAAPTAKPDFAVTGITSVEIDGAGTGIIFTHSAAVTTSKFVAIKSTGALPSQHKVPFPTDFRMITKVENNTCIVPLAASPQEVVITSTEWWASLAEDDWAGISIMPLSPEYAPGLEFSSVLQVTQA